MRINDGGNRNAWREPDDGDVITRPRPPATAPASAPAESAPTPAAPAPITPFWAAGTPVPPNVLGDLPPAGVQAPPEPAPAALAPAPATASTLTTPASSYVGERPADPAWLAARETALVAVRSDYQIALAQAQANPGAFGNVNSGWVPASLTTDESGRTYSASNAALVNLSDPNAPAVITGWNEGSPVYGQPVGASYEFNEAAFAAGYRAQAGAQAVAQPGSPLQALATLYDSPDATALFAQHPDLWHIATHDHALNAGPAKAGFAMGNASQLGMTDLYLADPQINALVNAFGGSVAPATGSVALEQVRLYGQQRYDQLSRLGNAMQSVRDQYTGALAQAQAQASSTGPGWTERARTVTFSDESGAQTTRPVYITDESGAPLRDASGQPQTVTDRVFDPDAFTAWYIRQPGLQNKAFGDFYGASHTQYANDESGRAFASSIGFDNANWSMGGVGTPMGHRELVGINPNDPPDLNDSAAVGFDFDAGWATHRSNIHQDTDWFETAFKIVAIAAVAWFSAGTLGPAVAGSMGMSTAAAGAATTAATLTVGGMIVSAAVVGAATSLASGMLNDNLTLKGVLRGALSGALTAGLMQGVSAVVGNVGTVGAIAARTTVQGAVQALMGGSFRDGAIAGLASGLADAAAGQLNAGIDKAVLDKTMTAAEGFAAHNFARVIGSAIRAAASPGDPGQAFASAFLDDVFRQVGDPAVAGQPGPAIPNETPPDVPALDLPPDALVVQGRFVPDLEHDRVVADLNAELGIDPDRAPPPFDDGPATRDPDLINVGWPGDAAATAANYAQRLAGRVGGELGELFQRGARAASTVLSYGDISALETIKEDIRTYLNARAERGGLSEAEMVLFGTLYAANEALFPVNALDFAGGIGKGIKAAGAVIVAGRGAEVLATTTRAISVEQAATRQVQAVEQAARARGIEVVREVPGARGQWNDALSGSLKPNAVYLLDNGHAYMTDALGRVTKAEGVLDLKRVDPNTYQQLIAGQVGGEGYEGGHLIAKLFGGAGERINLIPQLTSVNRGEFRVMEKEWADAIRAGKEVKVEVSPIYSGSSKVPDAIVTKWTVDGQTFRKTFPNTPGGG